MKKGILFVKLLFILMIFPQTNSYAGNDHNALLEAKAAADTSTYDAIKIIRSALERKSISDTIRAFLTFDLAVYTLRIGDSDTAQILFDEAFGYAREENMERELGAFYLNYGRNAPAISGQNIISFDLFHHAAAIARKTGDKVLLFNSYIELTNLFSIYEEFNTAKKYISQAEEVSKEIFHADNSVVDTVRHLLNRSYFNLYLNMKMYNSAFHFGQKSLEIARIDSLSNLVCAAYTGLGDLALAEEDLKTAKKYFHKAMKIADHNNNYAMSATLKTRLAYIANLKNKYQQCLQYNLEALELREKYGHKTSIGSSLSNIGAALTELGRSEEAESYLQRGLIVARELKKSEFTEYAYTKLISLFEKKSDYKSAFFYSQRLIAFRDSLNEVEAHTGLVKSVAAESLYEKEAEIAKLNELNTRTKEQFIAGIIILVMLLITVGALLLSYKNKKIADENRYAREEIQKADKLKTEFLAQMSHEIRTPLNSISNFSSILMEQLYDINSSEVKETIEIIDSEISRLIRTMSLLLDMAQVESENYSIIAKEFNLKTEIIDPVVVAYKGALLERNNEIFISNNVNEPYVFSDFYSVEQIFRNLIDNAIKFTHNGRIEILLNRDIGNTIEIKIIDTGIGMSEEYMHKLFEPFSQEEEGYTRTYEGNGLGLALVKRFCQLNGIDLFIESEKNNGTTVTLRIKSV